MSSYSKPGPTENTPDSLFDLSMNYIINNLNTITQSDPSSRWRKIKADIILPAEICDRFLHAYQQKHRVDDNIANLFRDRARTRLRSVKLRNSNVTDEGLKSMLAHKPQEIELVQCEYLSLMSLEIINTNCENLVSLKIGPQTYIIPQEESMFRNRGCILSTPNLKCLTIQRRGLALLPLLLLRPLNRLTYLDLSECTSLGPISCLTEMEKLKALILHNVYRLQEIIDWVLTIPTLQFLDISQSNDRYGKYYNPNETLAAIVTRLPKLRSLDISGTNLAGSGAAAHTSTPSSRLGCDIPGLVSRTDKPLEFLGLYGTLHGACKRHDIPALVITGDANENQILTAATAYMERPEMLTRILNDLYYLFRYENNLQVIRALEIVLEAMDKHLSEKHIQISGSATLFYIVKGKDRWRINIKMKRRIITALLVGMEAHMGDETMMRNGCLTLCQFKIPADVIFEYEKMVLILMHGVSDSNQESFVQRIAIYLLNSLACQVDGNQKEFLGNHGAIKKMLNLISDRLERHVCDDVLEVAWSTMWNVTDETPQNCARFLDLRGMEFFLACLKCFPDKEELLRNMMGLLGNVAEVVHLRSYLMTPVYLKVFYDLLASSSDGIEVSYNAAGVLVHMASDGAELWTVAEPSRETVLERVATAIECWDLSTERNINYRSFEPILNLLKVYHTPQCQHWSVWALANLTTVYPDKYCGLIESEDGVELLQDLLVHDSPYLRIKELAIHVLDNFENYRLRLDAAEAETVILCLSPPPSLPSSPPSSPEN